ncbi:hypothetical protein [Lentzea kentuckyensis]|uniref:hypothetical protein n=1 Tax=Lentzea kentuckyensis TaxID=360086 RepID=UPI00117A3988|nr:hypothetical protein [Lentzea kentuckyensis]
MALVLPRHWCDSRQPGNRQAELVSQADVDDQPDGDDQHGEQAQVTLHRTLPLTEEAWRCYNAGAIRASIAATWTVVTADITAKLILLADDGDAAAACAVCALMRY